MIAATCYMTDTGADVLVDYGSGSFLVEGVADTSMLVPASGPNPSATTYRDVQASQNTTVSDTVMARVTGLSFQDMAARHHDRLIDGVAVSPTRSTTRKIRKGGRSRASLPVR